MAISKQKLILQHLLKPNSWQEGVYPERLERTLGSLFRNKAFALNSGRSALYLALKAFGIGKGDEVLIQAYTCNSVPNPVLWTGAKPVYVDIDIETLNMDVKDLEKKITPSAKAIIVQHTFGNPAKIKEILKIASQHKLKVIEDCAHSLGTRVEGKLTGTFGDAAILSFGREKVISSLTGGALLINDESLISKAQELITGLKPLSKRRIGLEIGNFFSWRTVFRPIFSKEWGRSFINFLYHFDAVNVVTSRKELDGLNPGWYPAKMPNLFAHIALIELDNFTEYNRQREEIAQMYYLRVKNKDLKLIPKHTGIYLRVVALHSKASRLLAESRKLKMNFGNWYDSVVYPDSVHLAKLGYESGTCPVAEKTALQTVNLPNYLGMKVEEVDRVIEWVNKFS